MRWKYFAVRSFMVRTRIEVTSAAYLAAAASVLLLPLQVLICGALAAAWHEICHCLTLKLCRIPVAELKIGILGASISTGPLTPKQEILCAAAGPIGSLSLLILIHFSPMISIFGLIQGCFNLLPVYPLDGGRILRGIIEILKEKSLAKNDAWRYNSPD